MVDISFYPRFLKNILLTMKKYFWIIILCVLVGCTNNRNRKNYLSTFKRTNNLYIENYRAGLIGNLTSEYLTDSTNFRIYIGTFDDEDGYFYYKINGDNLCIEKRGLTV
jgi:hypothetical protein